MLFASFASASIGFGRSSNTLLRATQVALQLICDQSLLYCAPGSEPASRRMATCGKVTRDWTAPAAGPPAPLMIYNSFVDEKVPFVPAAGPDSKQITWYACGPTVYDVAHMGHARNYLTFDIVRRILEDYFGYNILMVMNVTDVDDKIILRARRNYLLSQYKGSGKSPQEVGWTPLATGTRHYLGQQLQHEGGHTCLLVAGRQGRGPWEQSSSGAEPLGSRYLSWVKDHGSGRPTCIAERYPRSIARGDRVTRGALRALGPGLQATCGASPTHSTTHGTGPTGSCSRPGGRPTKGYRNSTPCL